MTGVRVSVHVWMLLALAVPLTPSSLSVTPDFSLHQGHVLSDVFLWC